MSTATGPSGIALGVIGTLVVMQAAYAIWLLAIAWMAPPRGARAVPWGAGRRQDPAPDKDVRAAPRPRLEGRVGTRVLDGPAGRVARILGKFRPTQHRPWHRRDPCLLLGGPSAPAA
jgi:hypothetical protein